MPRRNLGLLALLLPSLVLSSCATGGARRGSTDGASERFELLATTSLSAKLEFDGTLVGGLSGIFWAPEEGHYLAVSDDPSEHAPARIYELAIERSSTDPSQLEVDFVRVVSLLDENGKTFRRGSIDPEGIAPSEEGSFWVSSEGNAQARIGPTVTRYNPQGQPLQSLEIPPHFQPEPGKSGVRDNQAFESLTRTPGGSILFTATEGALYEDGPEADVGVRTPARILRYDLARSGAPTEYRYWAEAVVRRPALPGAFRVAGLVELLALDESRLLALERSFGVGTGFTIRLYELSLRRADKLPPPDEIEGEPRPIRKELLLDLSDLGIAPRNLEGMTFGPDLPDGRRSLLIVGDNNFRSGDQTQLILLAFTESAR